ncbi:MAG: hypothetical protein HY870_14650 [Chloroflexi bacterium]|nr:hypothetical protein [Chloroflexota bacterium]
MKKSLNYFSYLLRLWREGDAVPWRASLEDPHTGQRRNFARLQDLFKVLEEETQVDTETSRQVDKEAGKLVDS